MMVGLWTIAAEAGPAFEPGNGAALLEGETTFIGGDVLFLKRLIKKL